MFDHISLGVSDMPRSGKFYDAALKPLGYTRLSDGESSVGYGAKHPTLWIGPAKKPVKPDMESGLMRLWLVSLLALFLAGHPAEARAQAADCKRWDWI